MNNTIQVFYPAALYQMDRIAQAVQDYANICRIEIETSPSGLTCTFSESSTELALTAREFSNYVCELENTGGRNDRM